MTDAPETGTELWKFSQDEMYGGWRKWTVVDGDSWPITLQAIPQPGEDVPELEETISSPEMFDASEYQDESAVPEKFRY